MENNITINPKDYLQKGYGIGADNLVQGKQLSPKFNDLKEPGTFINHVENLKKNPDAVPNSEILHKLIENIEPLDFEIKAFPEAKDIYNTPIEKGIGPNPEYTGKYSRIIT